MPSSWITETLFILSLAVWVSSCLAEDEVEYDAKALIINGKRKIIISGSIHYPRSTPEMWPDLIYKAKEGGLDAIETYIFWNAHEPRHREYNFSGNLDFIKFFQDVQAAGLYGIVRIGPYACAEWNYGGFPVWLHNIPGIKLRTDNEIYKNEMEIFTSKIVNMLKGANLFASQGGPIILAQIENEYGNVMEPYGTAGKAYVQWCAQMAVAQNIGVPWIMCQQPDAPPSVINTCNGFYCDQFSPNNPKSPKIWTENWTGWFKTWGAKDPHRTAEDVAFAVARFFQYGGILQNYYMYHGGTNFGRTAGGPFITTSYDYDAPLNEYGNFNQPKWGHLKNLHAAIKLGEDILTSTYSSATTKKLLGDWVEQTIYSDLATGERFCFLVNKNTSDANIDLQQDGKYFVPAWSVSILQGCNKEVFNTAKVNVQTSLTVKKVHENDTPQRLSWMWAPENLKSSFNGNGNFRAKQLLDQKLATSDESDYLWYSTRVDSNATSNSNVTLRLNFSGHVLYAFINRRLIGSETGTNFTFEKPGQLRPGPNLLTLLSITVGLQNYGSFFDEAPEGIAGGPVQLINGNTTTDLSSFRWNYKIGLSGERKRLYDPNSPWGRVFRSSDILPVGRAMTWYKTTFQAPSGSDPVVLDMIGMGKGQAWVNGHSLGRFWVTQIADRNGCSSSCDYRGTYDSEKCLTNCGNPTQRWYHVPRSFLNRGQNTLILFEEVGGSPLRVGFQIFTAEIICGNAYGGNTLELSCPGGRIISDIVFASFGDPQGSCGSFIKGDFEATHSISAVEKACVGKRSCSIPVTNATFGVTNFGSIARLAVQALCMGNNEYENARKG